MIPKRSSGLASSSACGTQGVVTRRHRHAFEPGDKRACLTAPVLVKTQKCFGKDVLHEILDVLGPRKEATHEARDKASVTREQPREGRFVPSPNRLDEIVIS